MDSHGARCSGATAGARKCAGLPKHAPAQVIPVTDRHLMWTSSNLYGLLENDIYAMGSNQTLVRQSKAFFGRTTPGAIEVYLVPFPLNKLNEVLHDALGPLGTIDLYVIAPPLSLLQAVLDFRASVTSRMLSNASFASHFDSIESLAFHPTPIGSERGILRRQSNVQQRVPDGIPWRVLWMDAWATGFASVVWDDASQFLQICLVCAADEVLECSKQVQLALDTFLHVPLSFEDDMMKREVYDARFAMMQFVANDTYVYVESQLLLDERSGGGWQVLAWMAIYDWALGIREVVSFQCDVQTLNLISSTEVSFHAT
ncbi:Aste57867_21479 [Aphanomyces stellatus]|uniref:Aste57867_21479 protein n=1 Tax=Aphanomyces stellatus TaxID=120398 RepID=A0A485LHK7_9STRA|nr:hypothetical protein As57867_021410 [Aphanomyces stellatus]VFT98149.1 Aste57867_21479 [Aphanomyces stellatus]